MSTLAVCTADSNSMAISQSPLTSDTPLLEYEPALLMLASLDAGWTRSEISEGNMKPLADTFAAFKKACHQLLGNAKDMGLTKSFEDWTQSRTDLKAEQRVGFSKYLYQPLNFIPWAHEDNLCLVLMDDIDSPQTIVETFPQLTEEVAVAACVRAQPYLYAARERRMEHYAGKSDTSISAELFAEAAASMINVTEVFNECLDDSHNKWPLILISRFKLNGVLSTAGASLCIQDGIFELLTETVLALALEDVTNTGEAQKRFGTSESENALWGNSGAGKIHFQVSLLDLQDEEEVGLLIRCANYSHGMRILMAVQSLTLSLLWKIRPHLVMHLQGCPDFRSLVESVDTLLGKTAPPPQMDSLADCMAAGNHLFRWTRTTAAIDWNAYQVALEKHPPQVGQLTPEGLVHAIFRANVNPGHLDRAQLMVDKMCTDTGITDVWRTPETSKLVTHPDAWWNVHLGSDDLVFNPATSSQKGLGPAFISIHDLIQLHGQKAAGLAGHSLQGRDLLGWVSSISVPVTPVSAGLVFAGAENGPQMAYCELLYAKTEKPSPHRAMLQFALRKAAELLFPRRDALNSASDIFSEHRLLNATRKLGLPGQFRRSVISLYSNFRSLLANPLVFDVAIDLYDALISFYEYLAIYLPTVQLQAHEERKLRQAPRLPAEEAEALGRYLEALEAALSLRLRHLYPEPMRRDLSVDFRGGLRQLLVAGDAVLKTALGLVRNHACQSPLSNPLAAYNDFNKLGVVHMLGFQQGMYAHLVKGNAGSQGDNAQRPLLAYFESDLAHAIRPASFGDIYHEAFHVAYELRRAVPTSRIYNTESLLGATGISSKHSRWKEGSVDLVARRSEFAQEVYVHLCMGLNFYHGDMCLMLREHARDYSARGVSGGGNIQSRFRSLTRNLAPALLAACLICACRPRGDEHPEDGPICWCLNGYLDFAVSPGSASESKDNLQGFPSHQFPDSKSVVKWCFKTFRSISLLFSDLDDACLELGEQAAKPADSSVRMDDGSSEHDHRQVIRILWKGMRKDLYEVYEGLRPDIPGILEEARLLHRRIVYHTVGEKIKKPHGGLDVQQLERLKKAIEGSQGEYGSAELVIHRTTWNRCREEMTDIREKLLQQWKEAGSSDGQVVKPVANWTSGGLFPRLDPTLFIATSLQAAQQKVWQADELGKLLDFPPPPRPTGKTDKGKANTRGHYRYFLDRKLGATDHGEPCFNSEENKGKSESWNPQSAGGFLGYSEFLIDPSSSRLFCPVPAARQRRVGAQLMLYKAFWDIASHTRLRRLAALLKKAADSMPPPASSTK
jgi:hypothetical protein